MRTLIVYATQEGQTERIAKRISQRLSDSGLSCDVFDIQESSMTRISLGTYDGLIFGSSLHYGQHDPLVAQCIRNNRELLRGMPTAFFSVGMGIVSNNPEDRVHAEALAAEFVDELQWNPGLRKCFAGALRYSRYGWIKKRLMRWIAKKTECDTDISHDHEYTDWKSVNQFAEDFLQLATKYGIVKAPNSHRVSSEEIPQRGCNGYMRATSVR